jgi:hypothetical protein
MRKQRMTTIQNTDPEEVTQKHHLLEHRKFFDENEIADFGQQAVAYLKSINLQELQKIEETDQEQKAIEATSTKGSKKQRGATTAFQKYNPDHE